MVSSLSGKNTYHTWFKTQWNIISNWRVYIHVCIDMTLSESWQTVQRNRFVLSSFLRSIHSSASWSPLLWWGRCGMTIARLTLTSSMISLIITPFLCSEVNPWFIIIVIFFFSLVWLTLVGPLPLLSALFSGDLEWSRDICALFIPGHIWRSDMSMDGVMRVLVCWCHHEWSMVTT